MKDVGIPMVTLQTSDNNVFPTLPEWSSSWLPGRNNRDHTWEPRPDRTSLSQTLQSITITPNYNKRGNACG